LCVVGFSERSRVKFEVFNSAAIIGPGKKVRLSRKRHIPAEENHYFIPGSTIEVFDTHVGKIGVAICYDQLFPEAVRIMALKGAEIIIAISVITDLANFRKTSYFVPIARALENQVHVVFCNACGMLKTKRQPVGLLGESMIISSLGEIVSKADGASECVVRGSVSEEGLKEGASFLSFFRDRQPHLYGPLTEP
jgi:predicted amidohydrolase